ncbi:ABC-type phosphate/phosphonate transport system, ATPase component [Corynebacterium maris DSM 45190]|uniref:ABC-type phosphate/phosphonate transport system, ATPase component n=1 Tax=Corynebacterium maris DSM 45190 TaxID=1224163 RepID=S5SZY1_9CORY|nr:ATP-binding cassette domain-containing protein [Corynebacterium maris]AGS33830.1 ABC-type phosphate/phosphonate transport system, ATPase component [Corynebacterium maris DSM 45190]
MITVRDLSVRYDDALILDGVNLDLRSGTTALLGPSGAGKSTLLKTLTGFSPITFGTVHVGGVDVGEATARQLRELRSRVGHVFQQFHLIGRLPVLTNVLLGAAHRAGPVNLVGGFRPADRKRAQELLERVGVADKAHAQARTLSGGQQQRVAIARALMQDPEVILADEPTASLDPATSRAVIDLLRGIEDVPVLISLHDPALALEQDRVIGLRDGKIVLDDDAVNLHTTLLASMWGGDD